MDSISVMYFILFGLLFTRLVIGKPSEAQLNYLTQQQLQNRYKVPSFDMGMPKYNLRWGYLIFGSPYLKCHSEHGKYAIRKGAASDYPHCEFPHGLVNSPPFTKIPPALWGDGWGTDAIERFNPLNKAEQYVAATQNKHLFG